MHLPYQSDKPTPADDRPVREEIEVTSAEVDAVSAMLEKGYMGDGQYLLSDRLIRDALRAAALARSGQLERLDHFIASRSPELDLPIESWKPEPP